uniref:Uncharacterized protein LOC111111636 n=1 Tax=Crassostrea virginica TaxID=6565 RepID=A0A8B8BM81_CRAVI|nr:uncharacterized protein LOC111111636 [Crassostrea virginica]
MDYWKISLLYLAVFICFRYVDCQCDDQNQASMLGMKPYRVYFPSTNNETTYGRFLWCQWHFIAQNQEAQIVYRFSNISVDCEDTLVAFVEEKDQFTSDPICGSGATKPTVETPSNELRVTLNSDGTSNDAEQGFVLELIAAKGNETCPQHPIEATSVDQQITSPRFPMPYVANLKCRYILTAPSGVVLEFDFIDVETHKDCPPQSCCDVINIYEGLATENKSLASLCGADIFQPNLTYESLGRVLTLELVTDHMGSPRKGFVARVRAKDGDPIPIPTTTLSTTFQTTQLPKPTTEPTVITVPVIDTMEVLAFSSFELRCNIPTLENGIDISWTKDGLPFLPDLNSNRYYFLEDESLVKFTSIFKEDAGLYTCEANSPFHPTYSARVIVLDRAVINECENNNTYNCPAHSTCVDTVEGYTCECINGWTGTTCEIDVDECQVNSSICGSNGNCVNAKGSYTCECKSGWSGENCETDVNECVASTNPCSENGKCINLLGSFRCECSEGWEGLTCEIRINPCSTNSCSRNSTCEEIGNTYQCNCFPGWKGDNCEIDVNECIDGSNPCRGNGKCINLAGSFRCDCFQGWRGLHCERRFDPCLRNSCSKNSKCEVQGDTYRCNCFKGWTGEKCDRDINECQTNPYLCSPNGICENTKGGYSCKCHSGWKGDNCRTDINECETLQTPCSGHGRCTNSEGTYICSCYRGWEGGRCERKIDPCLSNPCPENSLCKMKGSSYECTCLVGWEGPDCSKEVQKATGPCAEKCQGKETCYIGHNCTHYDHCFAWDNAACHCTRMICSFGTFWNAKINNCDRVAQVECKSDPCLYMKYRSTYPSHFNCRTFYKCNKNRQSLPMCCNKGYAYDHNVQGCAPDPYCKLHCAEREKVQTTIAPTTPKISMDTCYFWSVSGSPHRYRNAVSNIIQNCPLGTVFKADYCVCVQDTAFSRRECVPLVNVNFTGDEIINLSQQSYIQVDGVSQVESGLAYVTYGFFNGMSSSIQIPRLNAVALPRLRIQIRFFASTPANSRYQVLVSNCRSKAKSWDIPEVAENQSPSLAIIADTVDYHLTFLGYSDDWKVRPVLFRLPYKANSWNNVELVYNGNSFKGRIRSQNEDSSTFYQEEEKPFSGRIVAPSGPLKVGRCSDKDAFYGYIDMMKVFDCVVTP